MACMSTPTPPSQAPLSPSRTVGWRGIALCIGCFPAVLVLEYIATRAFPHLASTLAKASGGLVSLTLCFYVVLLVMEALVVGGWLRLRPSDVGLVASRLRGGIAVYAIVWLCYQGIFALLALAGPGRITLAIFWLQPTLYPAIVVTFLTYSVGVALGEEILFRGFLVPQTWQRLSAQLRPRARLLITLGISQAIFALIHIPSLLSEGDTVAGVFGRLVLVFLAGVLLALVWLQTGNLFIAVTMHGLEDGAIPLVHQTVMGDTSYLALVVMLLIIVLWPLLTRRSGLRAILTAESSIAVPARPTPSCAG